MHNNHNLPKSEISAFSPSGFQAFISSRALLRRRQARALLGLTDREFTKLLDAGLIAPIHFRPHSRAWYLRSRLLKLLK